MPCHVKTMCAKVLKKSSKISEEKKDRRKLKEIKQ